MKSIITLFVLICEQLEHIQIIFENSVIEHH